MDDTINPGTCEMCGAVNCNRWMLWVGDFAGWACAACLQQVLDCQQRRFVATGEETEPEE